MSEYIYVIGMDGDPQMPTKRKRHVEKLVTDRKSTRLPASPLYNTINL